MAMPTAMAAKRGSDETWIESVGVLEEESEALEEAEDDDVDDDQSEAEQDDNLLVRGHDHRAGDIGRRAGRAGGLEFDSRQIAVVSGCFSETCRFPARWDWCRSIR